MKIALVFLNLTVQAGGQQQVLSLAQELKKYGYKVKLYTTEADFSIFPKLWEGLDVTMVSVIPSFSSLQTSNSFLEKVWKKLVIERKFSEVARKIARVMDGDFDAVNCHEDFAYKAAFFYKKKNPLVRAVWTMNHPPYMHLPKKNPILNVLGILYNYYKEFSEKKYFKAIDSVAVLSRYEEEWCKQRGLPVRVVWSGIDFNKFYAPVKRVGETVKVLSVGALNPYRNYESVIEAVRILVKKKFPVSLTIIAKSKDEAYKNKLRKLSEGLPVILNFEGVSDEELLKAYRESDVYVLASYIPLPRGYGWGSAAFEAMAAGLTGVLDDATGAAHVLKDGENCLKFKHGDHEGLAYCIKNLGNVAQKGQDFVKKNLSWEKYSKSMIELYSSSDLHP